MELTVLFPTPDDLIALMRILLWGHDDDIIEAVYPPIEWRVDPFKFVMCLRVVIVWSVTGTSFSWFHNTLRFKKMGRSWDATRTIYMWSSKYKSYVCIHRLINFRILDCWRSSWSSAPVLYNLPKIADGLMTLAYMRCHLIVSFLPHFPQGGSYLRTLGRTHSNTGTSLCHSFIDSPYYVFSIANLCGNFLRVGSS